MKSVKVLQSMDHYERSKLADAIKEERYAPSDYVIKEVTHIICELTFRVRTETSST